MYIRTTTDEYEVQQNFGYGHGWEAVCTEASRKEAQERRKEYQQNQPEYPVRIVKKRVKKDPA